jgi:hypothetical protein
LVLILLLASIALADFSSSNTFWLTARMDLICHESPAVFGPDDLQRRYPMFDEGYFPPNTPSPGWDGQSEDV